MLLFFGILGAQEFIDYPNDCLQTKSFNEDNLFSEVCVQSLSEMEKLEKIQHQTSATKEKRQPFIF